MGETPPSKFKKLSLLQGAYQGCCQDCRKWVMTRDKYIHSEHKPLFYTGAFLLIPAGHSESRAKYVLLIVFKKQLLPYKRMHI